MSDLPNIFEEIRQKADDRVSPKEEVPEAPEVAFEVTKEDIHALPKKKSTEVRTVVGRIVALSELNASRSIYYVRMKAVGGPYSFLWRDPGAYPKEWLNLKKRVGFLYSVRGDYYGRVKEDNFLDKVTIVPA